MYTWGYIKEATLAKLDFTADQAIDMGLMNKFPFYANEAITQITSAIKPKRTYAEFCVRYREQVLRELKRKYSLPDDYQIGFLFNPPCDRTQLDAQQTAMLEYYEQFTYVGQPTNFPKDFFAWSDDTNYMTNMFGDWCEADDDCYKTYGGNQIVFSKPANYRIAYKAKWFKFEPTTDDSIEIDAPDDVLECLPSYIASQCFKIDDEQKSQIYRNEYEMFLARIDENDYNDNKTIHIGGGW